MFPEEFLPKRAPSQLPGIPDPSVPNPGPHPHTLPALAPGEAPLYPNYEPSPSWNPQEDPLLDPSIPPFNNPPPNTNPGNDPCEHIYNHYKKMEEMKKRINWPSIGQSNYCKILKGKLKLLKEILGKRRQWIECAIYNCFPPDRLKEKGHGERIKNYTSEIWKVRRALKANCGWIVPPSGPCIGAPPK